MAPPRLVIVDNQNRVHHARSVSLGGLTRAARAYSSNGIRFHISQKPRAPRPVLATREFPLMF